MEETTVIQKLTELLIKLGVTWFPKKLAERLHANDVVIVTRCEKCGYVRKHITDNGTVWYCPVHEHSVSPSGYCHNSEGK